MEPHELFLREKKAFLFFGSGCSFKNKYGKVKETQSYSPKNGKNNDTNPVLLFTHRR